MCCGFSAGRGCCAWCAGMTTYRSSVHLAASAEGERRMAVAAFYGCGTSSSSRQAWRGLGHRRRAAVGPSCSLNLTFLFFLCSFCALPFTPLFCPHTCTLPPFPTPLLPHTHTPHHAHALFPRTLCLLFTHTTTTTC